MVGGDLVKLQWLCQLSWDSNVLYIKRKFIYSSISQYEHRSDLVYFSENII